MPAGIPDPDDDSSPTGPGRNQLGPDDVPSGLGGDYRPDTDADLIMRAWSGGPRAFGNGHGAFQPVEPLPGITSGAAPKPWGLHEPMRAPPPPKPPGFAGEAGTLQRIRPADYGVDRNMPVGNPSTIDRRMEQMYLPPARKIRET